MYIFLPHKRTSTDGLSISARTWHAHFNMWVAQLKCAQDGPAQKKACLDKNKNNTGMYKHFMDGCRADDGTLNQLRLTLVDFMDTSAQQLAGAGHVGGPRCRCSECTKLKSIKDKWICRLGTFYGAHGLNTRDEIKSRSRVNFMGS